MDQEIPMGTSLDWIGSNIKKNSKISKIAFLLIIPSIILVSLREFNQFYHHIIPIHKYKFEIKIVLILFAASTVLAIMSLFFKSESKSISIITLLVAVLLGVYTKIG